MRTNNSAINSIIHIKYLHYFLGSLNDILGIVVNMLENAYDNPYGDDYEKYILPLSIPIYIIAKFVDIIVSMIVLIVRDLKVFIENKMESVI
jgi:hypothetical protein